MWNKQYSYYNIKKTVSHDKKYDSKFEANFGDNLELQLKAKEIRGFDIHQRIPLEVNGYKICDYYIDFVIYHNDETVEYVETKGYATDTWKLKWKLFTALYEDKVGVKITLVMQGKQSAPKIRKVKK